MTRTPHSTLIGALVLVALLGVALAAGCSSTPSTTKPTTAPTAAGTAVATTAGTAATSGSSAGSGALAVVSYDRIIPFLPKAAGAWKLDGEPQGMTMKDAQGSDYTLVSADYAKDGSDQTTGAIVVQDTANADTPYKQQWGSFRSYESTQGWWRENQVQGQPGFKYHDKSSDGYGQWILVGDRFIVLASVEDGTEADLDALINGMNLAGLAAIR